MFSPRQIENILFLDIETVSVTPDYASLPERFKPLWDKKSLRHREEGKTPEDLFAEKAGIHAEFNKIVCVSCGYIRFDDMGVPSMKMKSFFGDSEPQLLREFGEMVNKFMDKEGRTFCAHNGKEFDYPVLGRRYVVNQLPIPVALQIQGKKPWEVPFLDTMELWKFGDNKAFTSLDLLCALLDVPTPKDDIDGSQVSRVYWEEKDLDRIRHYCEKDVQATAQVLLRMSRLPLLAQE